MHKSHIRVAVAVWPVALGFCLLLQGCNPGKQAQAKTEDHPQRRNLMAIDVTDTQLQQLKIGTPVSEPVAQTMNAAARIEADATRMVHVSAPVAGRIANIRVLEGQRVHAGDVLATIYSTRLSDAQAAFLKAWSQQQLEKRAVDRAETLLKADVIGSAELLRRRGELDQSNAELAAARSELQILGMPEPAIARLSSTGAMDASANITAPISGTVLERKVTLGQIVESAETVFEIADLSNVWLVADVPEEASGNLKVGNIVEANATAFPDVRIRGRLAFVGSIVHPETRTVQVRMDLPNPNHRYKPDMLATMKLETPAIQKQVILLSAIVRNGDDDAVFVKTGEKSFLLTPVKLGEQTGNERVLIDGVAPRSQIVLDGAFNLNNERLRLAQMGEQ